MHNNFSIESEKISIEQMKKEMTDEIEAMTDIARLTDEYNYMFGTSVDMPDD